MKVEHKPSLCRGLPSRRACLGALALAAPLGSSMAFGQDLEPTRTSSVQIFDVAMQMPQLNRSRRIWVYLPPSYTRSMRRYPVLYMMDGQNLFDKTTSFAGEWQIDETLDRLAAAGDRGIIVVGIDNGGMDRTSEYHPIMPYSQTPGQADAFVKFILETLKPRIDRSFRTLSGRLHTGIMGASSGASLALYAGLKYPDVFGKIGCFSTPLWIEPRFDKMARELNPYRKDARYYFVSGQDETVGDEPKGIFARDQPAMVQALEASGFDICSQVRSFIVPDGTHSERFWAREFEGAYRFLFRS